MPGDAAAEALGMVAAVRDDPARRLNLAGRFYDDRPGRAPIRAYRRAELAFMRWQAQRGVLAAPDSARPGSAWWRSVNEGLLRDAWEADRLLAGRPGQASRPPVSRWADFLRQPSAVSWYRAHNASIVAGYLRHQELSAPELPVERFFMNVALARVLFAHALVARPGLALGRMRGQPPARRSALARRRPVPVPAQHPAGQVSAPRLHPARDPGPGKLHRAPHRLRRDPAPGPGAVRLRGGRPGGAPAAEPHPGRPARLRLDQRQGPPVEDHPQPPAQVRADLADLALTAAPGG